MKRFLTGFVGLVMMTITAAASVPAQEVYNFDYQTGTSAYQAAPAASYYGSQTVGTAYSYAEESYNPYSSQPLLVPRFASSSRYRTYPGGIAPYARYGRIFGFTRPGLIGRNNPYQGIDPQAGNPYAGHTVTRGPRDFLMKNPPNIGP